MMVAQPPNPAREHAKTANAGRLHCGAGQRLEASEWFDDHRESVVFDGSKDRVFGSRMTNAARMVPRQPQDRHRTTKEYRPGW